MSTGNDPSFDPYHKWLGIPKAHRPPNHYQLLGLANGESDAEVIDEAVIRQTTHLRSYQLGPHAADCTRILNEIAQAKQTLLHPDKKKAYDTKLSVAAAPWTPAPATTAVQDQPPRVVAKRRPERDETLDDVDELPVRKSKKRRERPTTFWTPPILAAAGGGALVIALLVVVIVVLATRSTPAPVPPVVQNKRPVEPPVKVVPPEFPPVKVIEKPVEPPLVLNPKGAGDLSTANGFWQASDPNDPNFRYQIGFAHAPVGKGTFRLTYTKNGFVLGHAHDENYATQDGVLSLTWVNDKPPRPEMPPRVATKFRLENNQLVETRADVGELRYHRLATDYTNHMGSWRGEFENRRIDLQLNRNGPGYGGIMFLSPAAGGLPHQTWINAIHPASNGLAWDLKYDRPPEDAWQQRRAQVRPDGAGLMLELSSPDKRTINIALTKKGEDNKTVENPPPAGAGDMNGYWQTVDADDPELTHHFFSWNPDPRQPGEMLLDHVKNGKVIGSARSDAAVKGNGVVRMQWLYTKPLQGAKGPVKIDTEVKMENGQVVDSPAGGKTRKFDRLPNLDASSEFFGIWVCRDGASELKLTLHNNINRFFGGFFEVKSPTEWAQSWPNGARPLAGRLYFNPAYIMGKPPAAYAEFREGELWISGQDLVAEFTNNDETKKRYTFKKAGGPAANPGGDPKEGPKDDGSGYWQFPDSIDPEIMHHLVHSTRKGEPGGFRIDHVKSGKIITSAVSSDVVVKGDQIQMKWAYARSPDPKTPPRTVATRIKFENNQLIDAPSGAPVRNFRRIDINSYKKFLGDWQGKLEEHDLVFHIREEGRLLSSQFTLKSTSPWSAWFPSSLRPIGDKFAFDVSLPGNLAKVRGGEASLSGPDLVVEFVFSDNTTKRATFKK